MPNLVDPRKYNLIMALNLRNQLFEKEAKKLGVEFKCCTAPTIPQSNGRIEGFKDLHVKAYV